MAGALTRRYHAILSASLEAPLGRVVLLNHLTEYIVDSGFKDVCISSEQSHTDITVHGSIYLINFYLDSGLPVWNYKFTDTVIEKRIFMPHMQNTVYIKYSLISGPPVTIKIRPSIDFRKHDAPLLKTEKDDYTVISNKLNFQICGSPQFPKLLLSLVGSDIQFILDGGNVFDIHHFIEADRGYDALGSLWTPGFITAKLTLQNSFTIIASCETLETIQAMAPDEAFNKEIQRRMKLIDISLPKARNGLAAELVIAADQFIISPAGRKSDAIKAHAAGDEIRSVIAGYHWFTDWGRDTMISLEGLTLVTGRFSEAGWILRTFAQYIRDGIIPNLFPEGKNCGLYHTADATLWFFHALNRYLLYTNDRFTLKLLLNKLIEIIEKHIDGTNYGIHSDPTDCLLSQGEEGYQLTWMDAKVEDWVVTPRRGKTVEINALWYNAIKLMEYWVRDERGDTQASPFRELSAKIYQSFNKKFWCEEKGYLYDVIDGEQGDDISCRPNQLFSISLDNPVLEPHKWEQVISVVEEKLLTPFGIRTLSQEHPDYKQNYFGDLRARDAAYHQGTVWAWLIGPFIDSWMKLYPDQLQKAREFLNGFESHLSEAGVGTISEIFDAQAPFLPRGCIAQAWSVAEVLRCIIKTTP